MPRHLDPDAPIASLLEQTGLSQSELGRRLGGGQSLVSAPLQREREGGTVGLAWLRRAARAAGFRLEIRLIPERGGKST
jgi:transcriptional regulator with XRE-family HTH domain